MNHFGNLLTSSVTLGKNGILVLYISLWSKLVWKPETRKNIWHFYFKKIIWLTNYQLSTIFCQVNNGCMECVHMQKTCNIHHALWRLAPGASTFFPSFLNPHLSFSCCLCGPVTTTTDLILPVIDQADDSSTATSLLSTSLCIYSCCSTLHLPPYPSLQLLSLPLSVFFSLVMPCVPLTHCCLRIPAASALLDTPSANCVCLCGALGHKDPDIRDISSVAA